MRGEQKLLAEEEAKTLLSTEFKNRKANYRKERGERGVISLIKPKFLFRIRKIMTIHELFLLPGELLLERRRKLPACDRSSHK